MKATIPFLLLVLISCQKPTASLQHYRALAASPETLPKSWIQSETTFSEVENENSATWYDHKLPPFEDKRDEWALFKSKNFVGAKLHKWASPIVKSPGLNCNARGYCLIFNDQAIAMFELIPICSQSK